jgi:hypothetical protein
MSGDTKVIEKLRAVFTRKGVTSQSGEDWLEDFSGNRKSDTELEQWAARLSGIENKELRQLIQEVQCMRWSARILLERVRTEGCVPSEGSEDSAFRLAAWLVDARKGKD